MIKKIQKFITNNNLDGYIIPKNDNYFTEYSKNNNLLKVSGFTGSAGFAVFLKRKNYLFVDGRYTLQAKQQSGKKFTICQIPYLWPKDIKEIKNKTIGFDPNLFTKKILGKYFEKQTSLIPIQYNFTKKIEKKNYKFFCLDKKITGEEYNSKIDKVINLLKKKNINYLYISASENVNWLLNIRGKDLPNSPLGNCKLIITQDKKIYFLSNLKKISKIKKKN